MSAPEEKKTTSKPSKGIQRRMEARVAAVEAIYSHEVNNDGKEPLVLALDMLSIRESEAYKEGDDVTPDPEFLKELIIGVSEHQEVIDQKITPHLQQSWSMERIGAVMRALLRVGVFELMQYDKLPFKAIINEYVNIAHRFCTEKEVSFVNGILDKIAREVREDV